MNIRTIIVGPLGVNCYIVFCPITRNAAVIDPGGDAELIFNEISKQNLIVKIILLTHGHFDHFGAAAAVKQSTGASLLMNDRDEILVSAAAESAVFFGLPAPESFEVDGVLRDGDQIEVGEIRGHVIATPGHSPGSLSFLLQESVFVGDTLFLNSIGRADLPGGNERQLMQSIRSRLFTLPDETAVYCGHGPATTIGREKRYNPFFV
ncbi:MAG: MBL fold metallo-hydrolase [Calditrichaeota bacterium]|nr:MAG: MBL fold metallo-hydrolase [Calditrichota bacterium]